MTQDESGKELVQMLAVLCSLKTDEDKKVSLEVYGNGNGRICVDRKNGEFNNGSYSILSFETAEELREQLLVEIGGCAFAEKRQLLGLEKTN